MSRAAQQVVNTPAPPSASAEEEQAPPQATFVDCLGGHTVSALEGPGRRHRPSVGPRGAGRREKERDGGGVFTIGTVLQNRTALVLF